MDESRKQFESWFKNYTGCPHDQLGIEHISDLYFMVWAASRAAIEIELPKVIVTGFEQIDSKLLATYMGLNQIKQAIRVAGIKVKE